MTPTLIFDEAGHLVASLGSPGGSRIIGFVAQSVIALLDWGLDAQAALTLPRHVNRNGVTELEAGTALEEIAPVLEALGHDVRIRPLVSGLHAVRRVERPTRRWCRPPPRRSRARALSQRRKLLSPHPSSVSVAS